MVLLLKPEGLFGLHIAEEGLSAMRFLFKTDYEDDIRLFPHSGYVVSYGILLALSAGRAVRAVAAI